MKNKIALLLTLLPLSAFAQNGLVAVYEGIDQNTGDQMLTVNRGESSESYRYSNAPMFYASQFQSAGNMYALYRCHTRNAHYASTNPNCEGGTREGTYGLIFGNQLNGTAALNRYYNAAIDKFYISTQGFNSRGYAFQGVLGYVAVNYGGGFPNPQPFPGGNGPGPGFPGNGGGHGPGPGGPGFPGQGGGHGGPGFPGQGGGHGGGHGGHGHGRPRFNFSR